MNRLPIVPAPGLNTNDTSFSVPGQCVSAANVRWVDRKPQAVGGWVKYFPAQLEGVCRNVLGWFDLAGFENLAAGTHTKLFVYANGELTDITPTSDFTEGAEHGAGGPGYGAGAYGAGSYGTFTTSPYYPLTWSLANWGQNLIANPRMQGIFIWENDTGTEATLIANAPEQVICTLTTPEQQVLALGCTQVDGTFNPMCIRGSKVRTTDEWTPGPDTTAFEQVLEPGGGGRIVGRAIVGSETAAVVGVWTDKGLYQGFYTGDPANIYRFDLIDVGCGLIGPNAVEIVDGRAWWWSPDFQCFTWAPGEKPSRVPCQVRDDFKANIAKGQLDKIAASSVSQYGEIWWSYPDKRDGNECSRSIFMSTAVAYGQPYPWSCADFARSALSDARATRYPIFVSPDGYVYSHEDGQTADGAPLTGHYTLSLPYLEEGGRCVLVKGIVPEFKDQVGAIAVSFVARLEPQDDGFAEGPFTLAPRQGRETFLFSAISAEMTISWSSSPAYHRLGKPVLLYEVTGEE